MPLKLTSITKPESQVLGPYLPTNPEKGCSLTDAKSILQYLSEFPQIRSTLNILANSTEGSGSVDLKWLENNCPDKDLPLQLSIEGTLVVPQRTEGFNFSFTEYELSISAFAADLGRSLSGSGRSMVESFLQMFGLSNTQLGLYYLCLKPVQDTITYTFSKF